MALLQCTLFSICGRSQTLQSSHRSHITRRDLPCRTGLVPNLRAGAHAAQLAEHRRKINRGGYSQAVTYWHQMAVRIVDTAVSNPYNGRQGEIKMNTQKYSTHFNIAVLMAMAPSLLSG